jgi:hypothetical protein
LLWKERAAIGPGYSQARDIFASRFNHAQVREFFGRETDSGAAQPQSQTKRAQSGEDWARFN